MTLWFGPHEIKAHKIVLSQAADSFKAVFESEGRDAKSPLLKLQEDDPVVVKGMIAFIYGLHFDGMSSYVTSKPTISCNGTGFRYLSYLIDLYVIAGKYLVTGLQHSIVSGFRRQLFVFAQATGSFVEIARKVYLQHTETAKPLRVYVLGVAAAIFNRLESKKDMDAFKTVVLAVPELSWELLLKVGQDNEEWRMLASQDG